MFDTMIVIAQTMSVAAIALWMMNGVWMNIRYPLNNELYTAQVLSMERLRIEYPDEFARVAHRAITDRRLQLLAFRVIVGAEALATLVLSAGVVGLLMALAGTGTLETAKTLALLGAVLFTSIWAAFLIVGDYFCYWFCHVGSQFTHYQMTLWGLGTMIFLVVA